MNPFLLIAGAGILGGLVGAASSSSSSSSSGSSSGGLGGPQPLPSSGLPMNSAADQNLESWYNANGGKAATMAPGAY